MNKVAYINSFSELKLLKKKFKNLGSFYIISTNPNLIGKNIFSLQKFIGEKKIYYIDNHKFRISYSNFLKKIDNKINSFLKRKYDFFFNSIHQQKKYITHAKNYHVFFKKILKSKTKNFIYFNYYTKNNKIINHEIDILDQIVSNFDNKNLIKIERIKGDINLFRKGCFEKNIYQYQFEDFNLKRKIYSLAKNIRQELFISHKKSICLMNLDRQQLNFFYKNYSDSYNLILLNNYIKGQGNKKAPISEKKFEEILININDKNFFHSIGFDKWLFKVFIKNYYEIFINLYFRFNDASKSLNKLNKKYKFFKYIYGVELPVANYVNSLFNSKRIKSLALSHGGVLGHYKNWSFMFFLLIKNKYAYYQVFSYKLKEALKKTFRTYKNNYFKNLFIIPSFSLINLKETSFFRKNQNYSEKIKNVCYVCSKNFHIYDLKKKEHSNKQLLELRLKLSEIFKKNSNINFTIKNYSGENFLFDQKNISSKNIIYISDGTLKDLDQKFDLFILESESTSLVEVACLSKKTICLQREYPTLLNSRYQKLKKSVLFCKKSNEFLKKINDLLKTKKIKKFTKSSFADDYYNIYDINHSEFKKSLDNFINT